LQLDHKKPMRAKISKEWSKPCRRLDCPGRVRARYLSHLAQRAYCSPACRRLPQVPSPSNNVVHRRIRDQQLALFRLELERIRLQRKGAA
jgi:hypothetical protein